MPVIYSRYMMTDEFFTGIRFVAAWGGSCADYIYLLSLVRVAHSFGSLIPPVKF